MGVVGAAGSLVETKTELKARVPHKAALIRLGHNMGYTALFSPEHLTGATAIIRLLAAKGFEC